MGERRERYRGDGNVGIPSVLCENDVGVGEGGDETKRSGIVNGLINSSASYSQRCGNDVRA